MATIAGAVPAGLNLVSAINPPTLTGTANVSITGESLAITANTLSPIAPVSLSGFNLTSAVGTLSPTGTANVSPNGLSLVISANTLTSSVSTAVSGAALTSARGTLVPLAPAGIGLTSLLGLFGTSATWTRLFADHFLTIVESLTALAISATSESLSVGAFVTANRMSITRVAIAQD